ncbi:MAG: hypothetical protein ACREQ9_08735, partial [Candidatus Binatia bacterium]
YGGVDRGIVAHGYAAWAWTFLGHPDRGLERMSETLLLARSLSQPASLAYAHGMAVNLYVARREPRRVQQLAEALGALATEHELPYFLAVAKVHRGWALAMEGAPADGISEIRSGLDLYVETGSERDLPGYLALLAEALARAGRPAEGIEVLAKSACDGFARRSEESALRRLMGELLLQRSENDADEAEKWFRSAITIARSQGAKWFELRATTDLARLLRWRGRRHAAASLLAEINGWFTEGFETIDLKQARALLDELS